MHAFGAHLPLEKCKKPRTGRGFLQIDEAAGELRAYSYSPYLEDYRYWDEPGTENEKYPVDPANEEITLPLPWA